MNLIKAALMRALKTFLQVVAGMWTAGQLITECDWKMIFLAALSASIYSLLMSAIAGLPEVKMDCAIDALLESLDDEDDEEDDDDEGDD